MTKDPELNGSDLPPPPPDTTQCFSDHLSPGLWVDAVLDEFPIPSHTEDTRIQLPE